MIVSCWCGNRFEDEGAVVTVCPCCHAIATLPRLSDEDEHEMQASLEKLLASRERRP